MPKPAARTSTQLQVRFTEQQKLQVDVAGENTLATRLGNDMMAETN
jgi:hypothetical protein